MDELVKRVKRLELFLALHKLHNTEMINFLRFCITNPGQFTSDAMLSGFNKIVEKQAVESIDLFNHAAQNYPIEGDQEMTEMINKMNEVGGARLDEVNDSSYFLNLINRDDKGPKDMTQDFEFPDFE